MRNLKIIIALLFIILYSVQLTAMPSVAPKDMMQFYIDYKDEGGKNISQSFTILRDSDSFTNYYYVPGIPRICVKGNTPEFQIVKYQDHDPDNREKLIEGAILQFSCTLDIPKEVSKKLKIAIVKKMKSLSKIIKREVEVDEKELKRLEDAGKKISPLARRILNEKKVWAEKSNMLRGRDVNLIMIPLKDTKVVLYSPGGDDMIKSKDGPSVAPNHAGAKMPFSLTLSKLGSNVFEELTKGNTGIPMLVNYKYSGLTAPASFKVTVDWDKTFKHFSTSQKNSFGATFGPFGAKVGSDKSKIRENLESNKCISIEIIASEGFEKKDIDNYLEPILTRINDELTVAMAPERVDPAGTPPSARQIQKKPGAIQEIAQAFGIPTQIPPIPFGVTSTNKFEMKDIKKVKKGKEVIDFTARQVVDRQTMAGGFIGIGSFPEEIRKKCVTVVKRGGWESAYFILPVVGDKIAEMGVKSLDMTINIITPSGSEEQQQTAKWTVDDEWTYDGINTKKMVFALQALYDEHGEKKMRKSARYKIRSQFTFDRDSFVTTQTIPMFTGDSPVASPLNTVSMVRFSFDNLTFREIEEYGLLRNLKIKMKSGKRLYESRVLKPADGDVPKDLTWIVDNSLPFRAWIAFNMYDPFNPKKKHTHNWKYNGLSLNEPLSRSRKKLKKKESKAIKKKIKKLFDEAENIDKNSKKLAKYLEAFKEYLKLYETKNITEKEYEENGGQSPLGFSISLNDEMYKDTFHNDPGENSDFDNDALEMLLKEKMKNNKLISLSNMKEIIHSNLFFEYDPDEDTDADFED